MSQAVTETVDMENPLNKWLLRRDVKSQEYLIPEFTRISYRYWITRLFKILATDEAQFLRNSEKHRDKYGNIDRLWKELKDAGDKLPQSGKRIALNSVRAYLRYNGIFPPDDPIKKMQKKTKPGYFNIVEGAQIIRSAEEPYREIFRIMVRGVMGAREFLMFNTINNWEKARNAREMPKNAPYDLIKLAETIGNTTDIPETPEELAMKPMKTPPELPKPYLKVDYSYRKSSNIPYYTLITLKILKEILTKLDKFPLETERGIPLDMKYYRNNVKYLDKAFHEAVIRSRIQTNSPAHLHQLRDMVRTLGSGGDPQCELDPPITKDAIEFIMGHSIDPNGYDQCWQSPDWIWRQLNRIHPILDQKGL